MSTLPDCEHTSGYLPPGIHPATHDELRDRFCREVVRTDASAQTHRSALFAGYEKLVGAFNLIGLPSEQWIGGSFISALPDPNDIDLVNFCRIADFNRLSAETRAMIRHFIQDKRTAAHCHCDSYFVPEPENKACSADFQLIQAYWQKKLGHDKIGRPKGIVARLIEQEPAEEETEESANADAA